MKYYWEEKDIVAGAQARVPVPVTTAGSQIVTVVFRGKGDLVSGDDHRPWRLLQGMNMATSVPYTSIEVADILTRANAEPLPRGQLVSH